MKTNAIRILENAGFKLRIITYAVCDHETSGVAVARKIGVAPERVFKTLVTEGKNGDLYVFVIPVGGSLDLKKAAAVAGTKQISMLLASELFAKTGYVHGGCSPVGMKKKYPTYLDETASQFETILVSGGKIGLQIEMDPNDLLKATAARYANLAKDDL